MKTIFVVSIALSYFMGRFIGHISFRTTLTLTISGVAITTLSKPIINPSITIRFLIFFGVAPIALITPISRVVRAAAASPSAAGQVARRQRA